MGDELLEALMKGAKTATTPLVPQIGQAGEAAEDKLGHPGLDDSPTSAALKGFAGGGIKGLAKLLESQTSPVALLSLLASGGLGAASGAMKGASAATSVAEAAPELGTMAAEFTPVGGEAAYNAARPITNLATDPLREDAATRYLSKLGGDETGAVRPEALIGAGAAGALGYQGVKLIRSMMDKAKSLNHQINPLQKYSDLLDNK